MLALRERETVLSDTIHHGLLRYAFLETTLGYARRFHNE
jgi:hypothetical protein